MLCVLILYISGGTYILKSTSNDRFFEKLFMAFVFTLRVFARNLLRENRRRNTFRISFWCLAWDSNHGFTSYKPTHYLLDHGDFNNFIYSQNICLESPNGRLPKKYFLNFVWMYESIIPCSDRHFYCVNLNKCLYWEQYFI